jgi:hypothetical protein
LEFSKGELVFLKLTPRRSVGKYKQKKNLQLRYIGPFLIDQRIKKVAYKLELLAELQGIHDIFHVSQLRKYIAGPSHVMNDQNIEMMADLNYDERPVRILEYGQKELRQKTIPLVKVLWSHCPVEDATWETELEMT